MSSSGWPREKKPVRIFHGARPQEKRILLEPTRTGLKAQPQETCLQAAALCLWDHAYLPPALSGRPRRLGPRNSTHPARGAAACGAGAESLRPHKRLRRQTGATRPPTQSSFGCRTSHSGMTGANPEEGRNGKRVIRAFRRRALGSDFLSRRISALTISLNSCSVSKCGSQMRRDRSFSVAGLVRSTFDLEDVAANVKNPHSTTEATDDG